MHQELVPLQEKGNYWGGNRLKIIQDYRAKGYNVMEASVSAFGSNYDRAVELYYYIKGGRVTMVRHMRQNMDTSVTEKHTPALAGLEAWSKFISLGIVWVVKQFVILKIITTW